MSAEEYSLPKRVKVLRVCHQQLMHYHNTPRGPSIKLGKDKDMINVIDKINNLGIISRIVSHISAKSIASKTQINDVCLLLSGLSGMNPSGDAKMYLTLPSIDGDERRMTSTQKQQ